MLLESFIFSLDGSYRTLRHRKNFSKLIFCFDWDFIWVSIDSIMGFSQHWENDTKPNNRLVILIKCTNWFKRNQLFLRTESPKLKSCNLNACFMMLYPRPGNSIKIDKIDKDRIRSADPIRSVSKIEADRSLPKKFYRSLSILDRQYRSFSIFIDLRYTYE